MTRLLYRMLPLLLWGALFASCKDDKYTPVKDLFQPRMVLEEPEVEGNSITLVWYKVNDAVSYTVELYYDNYYTDKFMGMDTTEPFAFIDDIPYGTTFYIRVRCNAADAANNSQWTYVNAATERRPEFAQLLEDVSKTEITENSATIHWDVDPANPVDSVGVMPVMDETLPGVSRYLTEEERASGEAVIEGLEKNTLYAVNVYDTSKPRKYDKPYNEVMFRTAGPAAESIEVGFDDDLTALLTANNDNAEIPEGTEYFLPAGSQYRLTAFNIKKGFRLAGSTEGEKPIVILDGWWNIEPNSYIASLEFQNIEFRQEVLNGYFFNVNSSYTVENLSIVNCDFFGFGRGFFRHQGANSKRIMNFEMEGCWINNCGWQTGAYGTFHLGSNDDSGNSYDVIDRAVFRNCTFSNDTDGTNDGYGWGNVFYAPNMSQPIHLEFKNITVYNFCRNNRLISIETAVGSELVVEGMVIASPCGDFSSLGANTLTTFDNNYVTSDYTLGGSKLNATELPQSAAELFADPANGDLTITDPSCPIAVNRAGDTRWIP